MNTTQRSVIPDAAVLVEDWERAAAGRSEPEEPATPHTSEGLWMLALYIGLAIWAVRSLCDC